VSRVAIFAINRTVTGGTERNVSDFATFGASSFEHFALLGLATFATGVFASFAAAVATRGLVGKATGCVEFLFTGGEYEFGSTVTAC
jgi:hypothetical protein